LHRRVEEGGNRNNQCLSSGTETFLTHSCNWPTAALPLPLVPAVTSTNRENLSSSRAVTFLFHTVDSHHFQCTSNCHIKQQLNPFPGHSWQLQQSNISPAFHNYSPRVSLVLNCCLYIAIQSNQLRPTNCRSSAQML
jgi:hypothetical protein